MRLPDCIVVVIRATWFGSDALELTHKAPASRA
jgi:hypothetical protein